MDLDGRVYSKIFEVSYSDVKFEEYRREKVKKELIILYIIYSILFDFNLSFKIMYQSLLENFFKKK